MDNNFIELTSINNEKIVVNFKLVTSFYEDLSENGMRICKINLNKSDSYIDVKEPYNQVKLKLGVK